MPRYDRSATEETLGDVLDRLGSVLTELGEKLEPGGAVALSATDRALLDGLESLLTALGTNTDGLESLLTSLGANTDQVETLLSTISGYLDGTPALSVESRVVAYTAGIFQAYDGIDLLVSYTETATGDTITITRDARGNPTAVTRTP